MVAKRENLMFAVFKTFGSCTSGIVATDVYYCAIGLGFVCRRRYGCYKCFVPLRHGDTLNSRRTSQNVLSPVYGGQSMTGVHLALCFDEFRGPRSDIVRQRNGSRSLIAQQIQSVTHQSVFVCTIRHDLQQSGMSTRGPLLRLPLTENNRRLGRHWCIEWRTIITEWNYIVFTDESQWSDSNLAKPWGEAAKLLRNASPNWSCTQYHVLG
ncbi:transposable element Tcb1 transposase [Trichonephila clavipes]|nr:transposable element Tcb1 transposase [Trichonephila clavipes]